MDAILYIYDPETKDPEQETSYESEIGRETTIFLMKGAARFKINFTSLTEEELEALHHLFTMAFANALETVRERDRLAAESLQGGDADYHRLFREKAQVIVREGDNHPSKPKWLQRIWRGRSGEVHERNPTAILNTSRIASTPLPKDGEELNLDNDNF